ncbi:MAG: isomerase [Gammaproteobacteria bacterium]|nr:MAG: isomerase [Gammaproteobacteria bacterium]
MKLPIYQIDAFANRRFEGNPAAVVPLQAWLSTEVMQSIAQENNLSETVFFVPQDRGYEIRWFTPNQEVKLCGHATLAAAFVLFNVLDYRDDVIEFDSLSGRLTVSKAGDLLTLDFPAQVPEPCELPDALQQALGGQVRACFGNEDYLVVFENEADVAALNPDYSLLQQLQLRGVIVTAPSSNYDFVSRFFAPKYGIPEDPVTGSAFTQLAPYWAERLQKNNLSAKQISPRGGQVMCELVHDRVLISGRGVQYLEGSIEI